MYILIALDVSITMVYVLTYEIPKELVNCLKLIQYNRLSRQHTNSKSWPIGSESGLWVMITSWHESCIFELLMMPALQWCSSFLVEQVPCISDCLIKVR